MTPLDYYQTQAKLGHIQEDAEQLMALGHLQRAQQALLIEYKQRRGLLSFLHRPKPILGVYLWGGVGIGKTFLMDCFYHSLPFENKLRMHFYEFMQLVHQELKKYQGIKDPLSTIAKKLAKKTLVLCFDEFFVSDITDAMILGRLFRALFAAGVSLITTSNVAPDDLYKNGLQRSQFLATIALLKQETDVVHITSQTDYRLRHLQEAGVFYTPLDARAAQNMEKSFNTLTAKQSIDAMPIVVNGRSIKVRKKSSEVIWFDFIDLCTVPRSQHDYLELAKEYHTILISDVPIIPASAKDQICLFIGLVDVMYDAHVRLIISAAEPVMQLYSRGYMILEYTRTHSRLVEMQSVDYFSGEWSLRE